jgi:hypothetical protein
VSIVWVLSVVIQSSYVKAVFGCLQSTTWAESLTQTTHGELIPNSDVLMTALSTIRALQRTISSRRASTGIAERTALTSWQREGRYRLDYGTFFTVPVIAPASPWGWINTRVHYYDLRQALPAKRTKVLRRQVLQVPAATMATYTS